jgi:hypothetical protein
LSPAGSEIDDEALARLVSGAVVAQAAGVWLLPGVDVPLRLAFEVRCGVSEFATDPGSAARLT